MVRSMGKINFLQLARNISQLQGEINQEYAESGVIDPVKGTQLADCRDYCMYLTIDMIENESKHEQVEEIVEQFVNCDVYCKDQGDMLHAGFFFTLSQLIAMKHKVTLLRGKAIERGDFERSWKRTREELAI